MADRAGKIVELLRTVPLYHPEHRQSILACCQRHAAVDAPELLPLIQQYAQQCLPALAHLFAQQEAPEEEADESASPDPEPMDTETEGNTLLVDTGLCPLVSTLGYMPQLRLWLIMRAIDRSGRGRVGKDELLAGLATYGLHYTRRRLNGILRKGAGIFWRQRLLDEGVISYYSHEKLWAQLSKKLIRAGERERASFYCPARWAAVAVGGSITAFKERTYVAWLKNRKGEKLTASRAYLCGLWGVGKDTLIRWEEETGVAVQANYARAALTDYSRAVVPNHATTHIEKKNRQNRYSWRIPNTYDLRAREGRNHKKSWQREKARARHLETLHWYQPLGQPFCQTGEEGRAPMLSPGRCYFEADKEAVSQVFYRVHRHVRRHGDPFRRHYVRVTTLPMSYLRSRILSKARASRASTIIKVFDHQIGGIEWR